MKKFIVVILLLLPVLASAQSRSYLGISAGLTIPSSPSDFKTYWTSSFNLGLDYEKPVSDMFGVGGELNYASFALDKGAVFGNSNANGTEVNSDKYFHNFRLLCGSIENCSCTCNFTVIKLFCYYFPTKASF